MYFTIEAVSAVVALGRSFPEHIKPEIIDSDQGTFYTCSLWVYPMKELKISINKDG